MGALNRYLANPYRLRALASRLLSSRRRARILNRIKHWIHDPASMPLVISGDIVTHFKERDYPVFFWNQQSLDGVISSVPVVEKTRIFTSAQELLKGNYAFRGEETVSFPKEIDWNYSPAGIPEWHRDLHRLDWLVTVLQAAHYQQDSRLIHFADRSFMHWWRHNPPESEAWHDPFEVAQRINTLCWILFLH